MKHERLCIEVERNIGRKMKTKGDFEQLSLLISQRISEQISPTTLMRVWGYRKEVDTRVNTVDTLARFLGYEDYDDFLVRVEASDRCATTACRSRWLKFTAAVVFLLLIVIGGALVYLNFNRPDTTGQDDTDIPAYVTRINQLSNQRQYYIHTRNDKRGLLGIHNNLLSTTFGEAQPGRRCDKPAPFAILCYEGSYYLYSVDSRCFINVIMEETRNPLAEKYNNDQWCALALHEEEGGIVIDYKCCKTPCSLNVNAAYGTLVTDWGTQNGYYDDGNLFSFEDIGQFDPTEALAILQKGLSGE